MAEPVLPLGVQDVTTNTDYAGLVGRRYRTKDGDVVEFQEFVSSQDVDVFPGACVGYVTGEGFKKVTPNFSQSGDQYGLGAALCIIDGADLLAAANRYFGFVLVEGRPANFNAASTDLGAVTSSSVIDTDAMDLLTDGNVAAGSGLRFAADGAFGVVAAVADQKIGVSDAADSSTTLDSADALLKQG